MQKFKNYLEHLCYSDGFIYATFGLATFGLIHLIVYIVKFFNWIF